MKPKAAQKFILASRRKENYFVYYSFHQFVASEATDHLSSISSRNFQSTKEAEKHGGDVREIRAIEYSDKSLCYLTLSSPFLFCRFGLEDTHVCYSISLEFKL